MKKIIAILALSGVVTAGFAQGYVNLLDVSAAYAVSTNGTSVGLGLGKTTGSALTAPGYYYALVAEAYPGGGTPPTATSSTIGNWTFAASLTNYATAGGITGGGSDALVSTLSAGTEYYVELIGWSAKEGVSYATVESEFASGTLINGGYFGESAVGVLTPGGASPSPAGILFGAPGIPSGFDLNYVQTPEPTTIALAAVGGLALVALRRKKA